MSIAFVPHWFQLGKLLAPSSPITLLIETMHIPNDESKKIFISVEPETILAREEFLIANAHHYHAILTFNANVLARCPNAIKYVYGTTWIQSEHWDTREPKQFCITGLFGSKCINNSSGYLFRVQLYMKQKEIKVPTVFFRSSFQNPQLPEFGINPLIGGSKLPLFQCMQYSIVIENSRQENYFTEKLLDCLLTRTIPIYYGCPNIQEYFDTTGWIFIDSPDQAIQAINALTPDLYATHEETITRNVEKAREYVDVYTNINRALAQVPGY
jgi:hypothetical protein